MSNRVEQGMVRMNYIGGFIEPWDFVELEERSVFADEQEEQAKPSVLWLGLLWCCNSTRDTVVQKFDSLRNVSNME